jgi:antitoxin (DNA-binding transcriptional repressor) of toxin-antitoxin stability system
MPSSIAWLHHVTPIWLCTRVDTTPESRHVGVRELRAGLADAVRRATAGQRTVVTSGGHPVAQLGPLDATAADLAALVAAGAVVPPRRTGAFRAPPPGRVWAGARSDQVLRELRG